MSLSSQQNAILDLLVKDSVSSRNGDDLDAAIVLAIGSKLCRKMEKKLKRRFGKSFDAQFLGDLRGLGTQGLVKIAILDPTCSIIYLTKLGFEYVQQRGESSRKDVHWWGAFADVLTLPFSILAVILAILGLIGVTISVKNCSCGALVPSPPPLTLTPPPQPTMHTPVIPREMFPTQELTAVLPLPTATLTIEQKESNPSRWPNTPSMTTTLTPTVITTPTNVINFESPSSMPSLSRSQ